MQSANNLAGFLVYSLRAPVIINAFQFLSNSIVFPKPYYMQRGQGYTLVDPTVSSTKTIHSLSLWILVTVWQQSGHERQVRSSFGILESVVDSKFSIKASEVTEEALHFWSVAIHNGSINERCDGVHLLSLESLSKIWLKFDKADWGGAEERHAAFCTREPIVCL